jgi:hypothetical protein
MTKRIFSERQTAPFAWARALVLAFLASSSQAQTPSGLAGEHEVSFQFASPETGIAIEPLKDGHALLTTFSVGAAPSAPGNRMCATVDRQTIDLAQDGWLSLTLSVEPRERAAYEKWLEEPSESTDSLTNRAVLQVAWRGLTLGFDALLAKTHRPQRITFALRSVPSDCVYVEQISQVDSQARKSLTFPVAIHSPGLLGPGSTRLIESVVEIAAHETTHAINLYPFDASRVRWLRQSEPVAPHDPNRPTSMEAEVRAVAVERCLRRLVMPRSVEMESDALTWLQDRRSFDAKVASEPALKIWGEVFRREHQAAGQDFPFAASDQALTAALKDCAMYLQRRGHVTASALPRPQEAAAAKATLEQLRRNASVIRFAGRQYR